MTYKELVDIIDSLCNEHIGNPTPEDFHYLVADTLKARGLQLDQEEYINIWGPASEDNENTK